MRELNSEAQKKENINENSFDNSVYEVKYENVDDSIAVFDMEEGQVQQQRNESIKKNVIAELPAVSDELFNRNPSFVNDNMGYDTKKIGSKVRFKPTDKEAEQNRRIDEAKVITKNATAYTLETYNALRDAADLLRDKEDSTRALEGESEADCLARCHLEIFSQISFTAKMFSSAYIRRNLKDCYTMVSSYRRLKEISDKVSVGVKEQIDKLEDCMELFTKRLNEYCKNNHIDMDNILGYDADITQEEKTTAEDRRNWLLLTEGEKAGRQQKRKEEYFKRQSFEQRGLNDGLWGDYKEKLDDAEDKVEETDDIQLEISLEELYNSDRNTHVEKLPHIKGVTARLQKALEDKEITDPDAVFDARKRLAEYRVMQKMIEAEIAYDRAVLEKGDVENLDEDKELSIDGKLFKNILKSYEDVRKMIKRANKPLDLLCDTTTHSGITTLTRTEALSTESDKKSFQKRMEILKYAKQFKDLAGESEIDQYGSEIYELAAAYFDKTFYKDGAKAESDAIRDLKRKINEAGHDHDQQECFAKLKALVDEMTNGSLPDIDFNAPPEGSECLDFRTRRPETTGKRKVGFFTKIREDALNLFRKWNDPGADAPLFAHEPTVNDLRQGKVSNCWMVSATTGLINLDPQIIKDAIRDNGDGSVTVRLFVAKVIPNSGGKTEPKPVYIKLNKEVPSLVTGGAIHTSGALWMQLLEKAAAFIGYKKPAMQDDSLGYDALWYGSQGDWIYALTGKRDEKIISTNSLTKVPSISDGVTMGEISGLSRISSADDAGMDYMKNTRFQNELFNEMLHAKENGYMYTYGTKVENVPGMNTGHAYTVLGVGEENGEKYVLMRNPYGNMNAVYHDDGSLHRTDYYMTSQLNATGGQFKIKFTDFLSNAGIISRVKLK